MSEYRVEYRLGTVAPAFTVKGRLAVAGLPTPLDTVNAIVLLLAVLPVPLKRQPLLSVNPVGTPVALQVGAGFPVTTI
jgi:hypothetical protein